ncbi:MAG: cysteine hydrolase [Sphingobium sp.]|uniref:cysteine hydrolase family protein n=1 Tax=Sphingobium sp. TaxID=1912891 RepID=UPI0029AA3200|nr:cysteine hydrolase [Sphingobium sp.]MDX3910680.1 cysteine hydrolase [Sphingobium sp.]
MPEQSTATAPEWAGSVLLTIDMQQDFASEGGNAYVSGTSEITTNCARLVDAFRAAARPIIHVVRLYEVDGSNAELGRRDHIAKNGPIAAPGTSGSQLTPALCLQRQPELDAGRLLTGELQRLGAQEWAMFKPRWSAFFDTQLEGFLRSMGASTVVVSGCNLPNCPRATLFDASERDFRAVLVSDATSQVDERRLADLSLIDVHVLSTPMIEAKLGCLRDRSRPGTQENEAQ